MSTCPFSASCTMAGISPSCLAKSIFFHKFHRSCAHLHSYRNAAGRQICLNFAHRMFAIMKDACRKRRVGCVRVFVQHIIKCSMLPHPPEAIRGTSMILFTACSIGRSKPCLVPSASMLVNRISPAPSLVTVVTIPADRCPVSMRPPLITTFQPLSSARRLAIDGGHDALTAKISAPSFTTADHERLQSSVKLYPRGAQQRTNIFDGADTAPMVKE